MSMNDPVSNMLTRIRNGIRAKKKAVTLPANRVCIGVARVLKEEGFIADFTEGQDGPQKHVTVVLKYSATGEQVMRELRRVSKPGRRLYVKAAELPLVNNGLGVAVVSTPSGIMSSRVARRQKMGGELICTVA